MPDWAYAAEAITILAASAAALVLVGVLLWRTYRR